MVRVIPGALVVQVLAREFLMAGTVVEGECKYTRKDTNADHFATEVGTHSGCLKAFATGALLTHARQKHAPNCKCLCVSTPTTFSKPAAWQHYNSFFWGTSGSAHLQNCYKALPRQLVTCTSSLPLPAQGTESVALVRYIALTNTICCEHLCWR